MARPPSSQLPLLTPGSMPSRFAENYLRREHKTLLSKPDVALTELIANAWDAGASVVDISLPEHRGEELSVADNGTGMTADEFRAIWPTLRYDRVAAKGRSVEFPEGAVHAPRSAYGSNGIGRHAMLCFAGEYQVETTKLGTRNCFRVREASGDAAIEITHVSAKPHSGHGTKIRCIAEVLPDSSQMLELLSARFATDPEFVVRVNGEALQLEDLSSLLVHDEFEYAPGRVAALFALDTQKTSRTLGQHGVTFWVGHRRVGVPGWGLVNLDGRLKEARRMTFIVRTQQEDMQAEVREDWTGFRESPVVSALTDATSARVHDVLSGVFSARTNERTTEVIAARREEVRTLDPIAQMDVAAFAREVATSQPLVTTEVLMAAVDALIRIENSRSGQALIQKLASLTPDDVEGLNALLDQWTVKDALAVLGEVGRRLRIAEAIGRLATDPLVDELHTLHPLVTHARWIFGVEFDTASFLSNRSLNTAFERIAGKKVVSQPELKRRPDLLVLDDGTIGLTAVDDVSDGGVAKLRSILLIELKKGGSTIGRAEMDQAFGYAEDLVGSPDIDGSPMVYAFVVGHRVDSARASDRELRPNGVLRTTVRACTYNQLVRTADARLHHLRSRIDSRLPEGIDNDLLRAVLSQQQLL